MSLKPIGNIILIIFALDGLFYLLKNNYTKYHMTNQNSHSEAFIKEMEQALTDEKGKLEAQLKSHARQEHGDYQANHPEYGRNEEENADEVADFIVANATTEAEEARLKNINAALDRIADGTYGVTKEGELIPEARLRANPAATTVVT